MTVNNTDYSNLLNQTKLANANSLLGTSNTSVGGLTGDMMNQWAMRHANSAAYRKLLQAQQTGSVKQNQNYQELMSDKYFNDHYDTDKSAVTKATYKPDDTVTTPTIDSEATAGDVLDDMRRLALAAINNPDSLTSTHYDFFETMRAAIASNFVSGSSDSDTTEVVVEDATPAVVTKNVDFHLLTDDQNFTVAGPQGEKNYTFSVGDSLQSVVAAINADSAETGVKAEWQTNDDGGYSIVLTSTDTGKDATVRVDQNVGDLFAAAGSSLSAKGTDALKEEAETVAKGTDSQAALSVGTYTGALFGDQAFTISGALGSQKFTFASGTSTEDVAAAINAAADKTGVRAEVIYNSAGVAEGLGLLAEKAGTGQYVQVTQNEGDLFGAAGKSVKVTGSSIDSDSGGPAIGSLTDLGRVTVNGTTYSFADLAPGGSASLANNPDAALAVLDQALKDIYEGRAQIKGYDPSETYIAGVSDQAVATASTNALEIGNYGSAAMTGWISQYLKADETAS